MPHPARAANGAAAVLALGLVAIIAGCGRGAMAEAAKRPAAIWADARAATARADDVHVRGTVTRSGQVLALDLDMSRTGDGGGTIDVQGNRLELVVTAARIYVRAGRTAWDLVGDGQRMARYAGRWVSARRSDPVFASLASLVSTVDFLGSLVPAGPLRKRPGLASWHGQEAVVLSDSTRAHIYVAARGVPHLLYLAGSNAAERGALTFTGYGATRAPAPPAHAVILRA